MWRCCNEQFGYCKGEPDWKEKPREFVNEMHDTILLGGSCNNDWHTCPKYQACVPDDGKDLGGGYHKVIRPLTPEEKLKEQVQTIVQETLFEVNNQ